MTPLFLPEIGFHKTKPDLNKLLKRGLVKEKQKVIVVSVGVNPNSANWHEIFHDKLMYQVSTAQGDHSPDTVKFPDIFPALRHSCPMLCYSHYALSLLPLQYKCQCIFYKNVHDNLICKIPKIACSSLLITGVAQDVKLTSNKLFSDKIFLLKFP